MHNPARIFALGALLTFAGCEQREEGVYVRDIPAAGNQASFDEIAEQLQGEDRYLWSNVKMRMSAADKLGIESASVREAIENERKRVACSDAASGPTEQLKCSKWPI
ncbi:MAG: hypothetical protein H6920_07855 [Sphingomonadaceae bacterium]|nr:hypothetical protein [Altererythrobacter sp.]MCP5391516.1 hypothetical protein [Sphingomonadaceae bacterium]MCP5394872.1 hypothetical protein [Sphingomonadaceae bacterium]MCP5397656.1 hypothetical protein [Sphingomonadaceae bacterium]